VQLRCLRSPVCIAGSDALAFGKGISSDDEPDLLHKDSTDAIKRWIEVELAFANSPRSPDCPPVLSSGDRNSVTISAWVRASTE